MTTGYVPRDYQAQAALSALAFLRQPRRRGEQRGGLLILPTGAGKSIVLAEIAAALQGEPVVMFQPSYELLVQNADKLRAFGIEPAIFSASADSREIGPITLATIGTARKAAARFAHVRHVLVDECHLVNAKGGMYRDFVDVVPEAALLGLTATPWRLHASRFGAELRFLTRTRPRVFTDVLHLTQIRTLVERGYWAPLKYYPVKGFEPAKVAPNSTGADFDDRAVQAHFAEVGFESKLAEVVRRLLAAGRRHILVFTRFVGEAQALARAVPGVAVVSAKTPDAERRRLLADFKGGRTPVIANSGVLAIGFDFPALDTVVLARPTKSLGLFYQQVGRGARTHPGKTETWIIDLVGLVGEFGHVEDLEFRPGGKTGQQWAVWSRGRQLTNVPIGGDPDERRQFFIDRRTARAAAGSRSRPLLEDLPR